MRDTGRSPFHLLLDGRASRDGACGSGRRRRARGPARRPRTLRRREDQGRPGKEGVSPRPGDASAASCANRACGRVRARTVRTAQDAGRRGQAREPAGPAGSTATPRTRVRRAILPMSASAETGRTCVCWSTWRTGASWIGNGVLDGFLEDESLFGEFLRTPVSKGGVESLVVEPPHIVVEVGA